MSEKRIAALEAKVAELERNIAHFQFQWLDRNAYKKLDYYKPGKGNEMAPQIPEPVKEVWRGDGWKG